MPAWNTTDIYHGAVVLAEWRVSDLKGLNYYHFKNILFYVTSCNFYIVLQIVWLYFWFDLKKKVSIKLQL